MADRDLYGVIIEEGPQNWQILQQTDGAADIVLAGHLYYPDELNGSEFVCARVVDEATGLVVCPHVSTTVQADRSWRLTLRRVPAGGLYRIETRMRFDVINGEAGGQYPSHRSGGFVCDRRTEQRGRRWQGYHF